MTTATDVRTEIEAANKGFMAAFSQGDMAALAGRYTTDGQLLPPHGDFVTGHAAIQAFWQGVVDMGIKEVMLETVEAEGHGDAAVEIGKYTMLVEGAQVADTGKYIVTWKNEQGTWTLHRDIWNSSQPAPESSPDGNGGE